MKGFIGGIPVALLAVAAQAKFAEREHDFHPKAGGTAIGGPSGNDGGPSGHHGDFHPQAGGTAIGGPSGNDDDGGFVSPYSANIKTDTKVNEWNKDNHSIKLKHTDVYSHPPVVAYGHPGVPHGPQVPGMGPFEKRGAPGGTAMGGPSGNDEGQSFDMSVTAIFNTETEEENKDDHSIGIKNTHVHPPSEDFAKRFGPPYGPPHVGGTAIGGPSGNDGGQSFSAPTNIQTNTEINEHNEDDHSIRLKHEDIYTHHHFPGHGPFRRSENCGPHCHGGSPSSVHFEPHPESHYAPHTETHYEPHSEPHYEPHPEPHYENHPEPHVENHPEPHYEPHYSPHYEPHYEPHTTLDYELTSVKNNNNGPAAGAIAFGRRGFPGLESHFEPHPESHYAPHTETHYEPHSEPHYEPHPEPHYENHPEPHVENHPEPHYAPHYSPSYEPHYEPHTTLEHEITSLKNNNNGPAAGAITFGRRGFPGLESHFEPHPESHYAPHTETHYEPHSEPHYEPHPEPHYENHPEPHVENHPEPHYEPHYSPSYEPHYEPHHTLEYELTSVKNNNNGPSAGAIGFGRRAYAPTHETSVGGGTAIGGPSGDDGGSGFSTPTNIDVTTGVNEHNEDNHAIDSEYTHVHPDGSAKYDREEHVEAPQCAAQVHEVVHTVTKTQYQTAEATQVAYQSAPTKSVGADPYADYPQHSAGADPYAASSSAPYDYDSEDPSYSAPSEDSSYSAPPEDSEVRAHATPAAGTSAIYANYPQRSAGADPYAASASAPYNYASQHSSYSRIPVHVPMATPASYGAFSKATPSSSMGKMIPSGVSANQKASPSSSASASASHGVMFQGDAARLSGGIVSAVAAVMGVLAFIL
ncbi:hypothetical protein N7471_004544 [Penicillium samsonianum]|uniref:uncharacterized protein n=1 Tax=Penicillium samsonianum TaxID=1882272 RepID=UPI0025473241|nr:uncharacterized protein N7471_004544 [Penicillium samsonianum]KAJ6138058.1 hypothetical protein N7471_004544 [Penicillium samsonianum]